MNTSSRSHSTRLGRKFQESFREVSQLHELLGEDTFLALRHLRDAVGRYNENETAENAEEAGFFAKAAIRAFLGQVDATGYALRRVIVRSADEAGLALPEKVLAELTERRYDSTTGTITDEIRRISPEQSIKLATKWFPKLFGVDFALNTSGEEWRGFKRLVTVRNDFTHPKKLEHLSPHWALGAIGPTVIWFFGQMGDVLAACGAVLGIPAKHRQEPPSPEDRFKDAKHPIREIFSGQDLSDIQDVPGRTLEYVKQMLLRSSADTKRAFDLIRSSSPPLFSHPHQFATRNAVRTLFSDVEAVTAAAAFFVDAAAARGEIDLSVAERQLTEAGEIEDKLVAVLTVFSREFGSNYVPAKTGALWNQFRGARSFRDCLMHPKEVRSLRVDQHLGSGTK